MGYIFKNNDKVATVGELLNSYTGQLVLRRLQAGRDVVNGTNVPHRLSDADFELLKDEQVKYAMTPDGIWATFVKPVNDIRKILGLPEQKNLF